MLFIQGYVGNWHVLAIAYFQARFLRCCLLSTDHRDDKCQLIFLLDSLYKVYNVYVVFLIWVGSARFGSQF
jgi:hypothetical protein